MTTNNKFIADTVSICNMALRHLGQANGIMDFDNDLSEAADSCRLFFPVVVDEVLRAFPWTFATQFVSLAQVGGPTSTSSMPATPEWQYSYRMPADAVWARRILPIGTPITVSITGFPIVASQYGGRFETKESRVPYRIVQDSQGLLILTDYPPNPATATAPQLPVLEYIFQQDTESDYPADFALTCSFLLAFYISPSVTRGDKFKLGDRAFAQYNRLRYNAQANAKNEEQPDVAVDSEFIQVRDS